MVAEPTPATSVKSMLKAGAYAGGEMANWTRPTTQKSHCRERKNTPFYKLKDGSNYGQREGIHTKYLHEAGYMANETKQYELRLRPRRQPPHHSHREDKSPCILVDDAAEEDDPPSPPSDEGALFAPKSTSIQPLRSGGGRGARGPTRDRIGKNLGEER